MAGIITDSLGRRWDPAKHPRDRKGRFIRTFHKVRLFNTGGSKPWGVGRVDKINDANAIDIEVTALARNNPESAEHKVGEKYSAQAANLESVNEKASLSAERAPSIAPEQRRVAGYLVPDLYGGFSEGEIWSEPKDTDSPELKEARSKFFQSRYGPAIVALAKSRTNVVPQDGLIRKSDTARSRDKDSMDKFVATLEKAGVDVDAVDSDAPDGLPALQSLIDQQNEDNPLPNGWKEVIPETLDREFTAKNDGLLRGVALTGINDEPDYFESNDDGESWEDLEDVDSFDDLFGEDDTDEPEAPKATLDPEQRALPAKPHSEDDFLAALEELWDDDETVLEEGEIQELIPGYVIERPPGSKNSTVTSANGEEIVKIPETADNERLQEAATKIFNHQQENLPEDEGEEEQKAELPPKNAPEEPLPEETPEPEPTPEDEPQPALSVAERYDAMQPKAKEWLAKEGFTDFDSVHEDSIPGPVTGDLLDAGFIEKDGLDTYRLTDDGQEAFERAIAEAAIPELDEEREERKIKDAEAEVPDGEEGAAPEDEAPADGPIAWEDLSEEEYALIGFDGSYYEKQQGTIPEHVETLEEQGLIEITRDMISEDDFEEWHATLTPEGEAMSLELRHRLGATNLIDPPDLTDEEITKEFERLDAEDQRDDLNKFQKNKNRVRRKMLTLEQNSRQETTEEDTEPEPTPEDVVEPAPTTEHDELRNRVAENIDGLDSGSAGEEIDDVLKSIHELEAITADFDESQQNLDKVAEKTGRDPGEITDRYDAIRVGEEQPEPEPDEEQPTQNAPDIADIEDALVAYENAESDEDRHDAATDVIDRIVSIVKDDEGNPLILTETREQYIQRYRDTDFEQAKAKWTSDEAEFPEIGKWLLAPGSNPKDTRLNEFMVDENGDQYRYHQRGKHKGKRIHKGDQVAFKFKTSGKAEIDPKTGEKVTREGIWIGTVSRFMGDPQKGGKINIRYVSTNGKVKFAEIDYDNVYDVEGMDASIVHNKAAEIQAPKGLTRTEEIDHFLDAWFGSDNQKRFSRIDGKEKFILSDGYYLKAREGGEPPYLSLVAPDGRVVTDFIEVPGFQYGTVSKKVDGPGGNPVHRFDDRDGIVGGLDDLITQDQNNPNLPAAPVAPEPVAAEPTPSATGFVRDLDEVIPLPDLADDNYLPARLWRLDARKHQDVYAEGPTLPLNDVDLALLANPEYVSGSNNLWTTNCYNAVTAFVLRMQGYDVRADKDDESIWTLGRLADRWWRPDREGDRWAFPGPKSATRGAWKRALERDLKSKYPPGSYGAIAIKYKKTLDSGGHVIVWYRDKNTGEIRFLEPQNGTEYSGNEPWGDIAQNFPVVFIRLDDLGLPSGDGVVPNTGTEFQSGDVATPETSGADKIREVVDEWESTGQIPGAKVGKKHSSTPLGIHERNGSKFVVKAPAFGTVQNEVYAAELLTAFGFEYHAAEGPDGNMVASFVEGRTGMEWLGADRAHDDPGATRVRNLPKSFELAVLDILMVSRDRHGGNWMIEDDDTIHPIDHEMTFDHSFVSPNPSDSLMNMLGYVNNNFIAAWTRNEAVEPGGLVERVFIPEWNNKLAQLEDMQVQLENASFATMDEGSRGILLDRMEHLIKLVKDNIGGSQ